MSTPNAEPMHSQWMKNDIPAVLLLAGLCLLAYLPSFNNGFISDDYVILGRLDSLRHDFLYLFSTPPENFRMTSYLLFGMLRSVFGYHPEWYYAFNLLLHLINSVLLWKLLARISGSSQVAFLAAVFFAAAQGHQEAIMWLAAMNETLLGLCLLVCLLLWQKGHAVWSALSYLAALFSKESALMLLGLLPLLDWWGKGAIRFQRTYLLILAPSAAFMVLFYSLARNNFMLSHGFYSVGLHAASVFLISLHRLMFPWLYLAFGFHLIRRRGLSVLRSAGWGLGFGVIALLPYIFLTYQNHVTSRQEYVASMGTLWALAVLIRGLDSRRLRSVLILVFLVANIGYIWIKDRQFEQRAAPTNRLIEQLRAHAPQDLAIFRFPANSWIAKNTSFMVPGWRPEMIHVDPTAPECAGCLELRWDPLKETYEVLTPR